MSFWKRNKTMGDTVRFLQGASVGHNGRALLTDVDLELQAGTVTRLVGTNGVGKSTLIDSALGLLPLVDGTWQYPHQPGSPSYQREIGYMPSTVLGYPNLTLRQWLDLVATGFSISSSNVQATWEDLGGRGDPKTLLADLSSGNRKKSLFVPVISIPRKAIFLDEPFEEVDLYGQEVMAQRIKDQISAGAAALIVSHRSVDHLLPVDSTLVIEDKKLTEKSEAT